LSGEGEKSERRRLLDASSLGGRAKRSEERGKNRRGKKDGSNFQTWGVGRRPTPTRGVQEGGEGKGGGSLPCPKSEKHEGRQAYVSTGEIEGWWGTVESTSLRKPKKTCGKKQINIKKRKRCRDGQGRQEGGLH